MSAAAVRRHLSLETAVRPHTLLLVGACLSLLAWALPWGGAIPAVLRGFVVETPWTLRGALFLVGWYAFFFAVAIGGFVLGRRIPVLQRAERVPWESYYVFLSILSLLGTAYAQATQGTTPTTAPAAPSDPSTVTTPPDTGKGGHGGHGGPHQANGKTETVLTGDQSTRAIAAAQAAVPGATVDRAETDAEGSPFEVHMTKADGSKVTVKLDADFKVTSTIDGMG